MSTRNSIKALAAGVAAGLLATAAKTVWEKYFPVRDESTPTPPAKIATRTGEVLLDQSLTSSQKEAAETGIHFSFGVGTGVVYALAAEAEPAVTMGLGLPFGVAFWGATHASTVPALGLEPFPHEINPRKYAVNEFAGHLVYALTLEVARSGTRTLLDRIE